MVTTPYIISGTIYDVDGTITVTDATLKVTNKRLNEITFTSSDSNGEYVIDLANYTEYRNGDPILIESYVLGDISKRYKSIIITVDTSLGYTSQDLTMDAIIEDMTVSTRKDDILQRAFNFLTDKFKIDLPVDAATETKQDIIITGIPIKTSGDLLSAQNPLPVDGDSVYKKDVDTDNSDIGTFVGTITDLVNDLHTTIIDTTSTNPKWYIVYLNRPLKSGHVNISTKTGDFSNVKITLYDEGGAVRTIVDDSTNNTKYVKHHYDFVPVTFAGYKVEFYTADTVTIGFNFVQKSISVISRIQGINDATGVREDVKVDNGELIIGGAIKLKNTSNTNINPATEDKQDALIHAEHSVHSSTDAGVMPLGVYKIKDYDVSMPDEGDYTKLSVNQSGALRTSGQTLFPIAHCNSTDGFTVLGNDTANLTTSLKHLHGTASLSFDKVNGAGNTVFGGVQKTLSDTLSLTKVQGVLGYFHTMVYLSSITNGDYFFLRVGTNSSNYNEWRIDISENWSAGEFNYLQINIGQTNYAGCTGNGWNPSVIDYIAFGVAFNTETDTLANILVDRIGYASASVSTVDMSANITSDISSPNINILKIGNKVVDKQAGNVGTGTQRFTIATDDVNLAAINTSVKAVDTLVTTAVTLITIGTQYLIPSSEQVGRKTVVIYNVSDTDMFYGDSSVTITNGILLAAGTKETLDCAGGLYLVCGAANKIVNVLELK